LSDIAASVPILLPQKEEFEPAPKSGDRERGQNSLPRSLEDRNADADYHGHDKGGHGQRDFQGAFIPTRHDLRNETVTPAQR